MGNFSEGSYGFSKFSKFLAEASSRGVVQLRKLENGQYEVKPSAAASGSDKGEGDRGGRPPSRRTRAPKARADKSGPPKATPPLESAEEAGPGPLLAAYDLVLACLGTVKDDGKKPVRDSDVKRRMLKRDPGFDEAELGFRKFSHFLLQAKEHGVIDLEKSETGNYRVSLSEDDSGVEPPRGAPSDEDASTAASPKGRPTARAVGPMGPVASNRLGPRSSSRRHPSRTEGPILFEGQAVRTSPKARQKTPPAGVSPDRLGLPSGREATMRYLANSYKVWARRPPKRWLTRLARISSTPFNTLRSG